MFAPFLRRDWIDLTSSTLEQFSLFVSAHPKFFVKDIAGEGGHGAKIVTIEKRSELEAFFRRGRKNKLIVEELIQQHPSLAEFCPDTLNTLRINTLRDFHGTVRILTAAGRFGRVGKVVDNFHSGGFSVTIDPVTGIILSDGINRKHERLVAHPDTGKIFRGFQYPCWDKVRAMVMAITKIVPEVRHVGWDIAITDDNETVIVEGNNSPATDVQQTADSVGRLHRYLPIIEESEAFKQKYFEVFGYKINVLRNFEESYQLDKNDRRNMRAKLAVENLIEGCASVIDVGCRADKFVKTLLPMEIKYYPVDFHRYDDSNVERESVESEAVEHGTVEREAVERPTVERAERIKKFFRDRASSPINFVSP